MVEQLIGKRISIPGQFTGSVTVESVTVVDDTVLLQVRTQEGELREAILGRSDIEEILTHQLSCKRLKSRQINFIILQTGQIWTSVMLSN
jgi:hypothetical protein